MKKRTKKIFKILLALILIAAIGFFIFTKFFRSENGGDYDFEETYYTVGTGDMLSSIQVYGDTSLLNEQKLKFNIDGTVVGVYVKQGQSVNKGDKLAELDKGELNTELEEANIRYDNAKMNLDKLTKKFGYEDKLKAEYELESMKNRIENLKKDLQDIGSDNDYKISDEEYKLEKQKADLEKQKAELENQKKKLTSDLEEQKREIEYKKNNLENDKKSIQNQIEDEKKNLKSKITDYHNTFTTIYDGINSDIQEIEENLKAVNKVLRTDSEYNESQSDDDKMMAMYYSAKNSMYKSEASNAYSKAKSKYIDLKKAYDGVKDKEDIEVLKNILEIERVLYDAMYDLGDNFAKGAENSVTSLNGDNGLIDPSTLKPTGVNIRSNSTTKKTSIDEIITKIDNLENPEKLQEKSDLEIEKLNKQLADLDPNLAKAQLDYNSLTTETPFKIKELERDLETNQKNYEKALKDLENLKSKSPSSLKDKELEIKNAELDYELALDDYNTKYNKKKTSDEIEVARNEVKQAQLGIEQVRKKIENYELVAPFTGTIDNISLQVGDKLSSSSQDDNSIYLINPNIIEISIKLDQVDIVKVKEGMEAQITFDSYPDKIFTGKLGNIDSKPVNDNEYGGGGGVKKYQIKIVIDKGDLNIFSGMNAMVDIVIENVKDAIVVPTMSVETDNETGENYVTVKTAKGNEKRVVETGINGNGQTQILSGLEVGEEIVEINFDANMYKTEDFSSTSYW